MTKLVLLDNTVLTNLALINQPHLVLDLWANSCTTQAVTAEYQVGAAERRLPVNTWQSLPIVTLTPTETTFANRLKKRLGKGERTCIAVAYHRSGLFASDDLDARRQAQTYHLPLTGTIGILVLNVRQKQISLAAGNSLLTQLIKFGYRSPVTGLDDFI